MSIREILQASASDLITRPDNFFVVLDEKGVDRAIEALNAYVEERVREARIEEMNFMIAFGYTPRVRLTAIKEDKADTMMAELTKETK